MATVTAALQGLLDVTRVHEAVTCAEQGWTAAEWVEREEAGKQRYNFLCILGSSINLL